MKLCSGYVALWSHGTACVSCYYFPKWPLSMACAELSYQESLWIGLNFIPSLEMLHLFVSNNGISEAFPITMTRDYLMDISEKFPFFCLPQYQESSSVLQLTPPESCTPNCGLSSSCLSYEEIGGVGVQFSFHLLSATKMRNGRLADCILCFKESSCCPGSLPETGGALNQTSLKFTWRGGFFFLFFFSGLCV